MDARRDVVGHSFESKERTNDVINEESLAFEELLLSEKILTGLRKSGFYKPSPIQLKAIPLGKCGLDLIVQAKSGTGKTCVFTVIALESFNPNSSALQVIVLAPTREIALQIHSVISSVGQDIPGLFVQVFIGGTQVSEDRVKAKKCHIAIGSPGRLKQLIELGVLSTDNIRMLVLDEADKLVEEKSFQKQINWIYSSLPINKQVIATSATYPELLAQFLSRYMRDPTYVRLDVGHLSLLGIRQYYIVVKERTLPHLIFEEKTTHVIDLLSSFSFQQALVFSNYHSRAESICEALNVSGWPTTFISGSMEQSRRIEAIDKLKLFKCRVLISTDLTSRGIDAPNVDLVINMDVPSDWETYMHRIGRAGRFGAHGVAVTLVSAGKEKKMLNDLSVKCNANISPYNELITDVNQKVSVASTTTSFDPDNVVSYKPAVEEQNFSLQKFKTSNIPKFEQSGSIESTENGFVTSAKKGVTSDQDPSHGDASRRLRIGRSFNRDSCNLKSAQTFETDTALNIRLNKTSLPQIPSLQQLNDRGRHMRKNCHYLDMNYDQLKADYEYFVKTGEFANPEQHSVVEAIGNNKPRNEDNKLSNPVDEPADRISSFSSNDHNPSLQVDETHEATSNDSLKKLSSQLSNFRISSASAADLFEPKSPTVISLPESQCNTSTTLSTSVVSDTPAQESEETKMATNLQSVRHDKPTNNDARMKGLRRRHPMCAAAAFDVVSYWAHVDEAYVNTLRSNPDLLSSSPDKVRSNVSPSSCEKFDQSNLSIGTNELALSSDGAQFSSLRNQNSSPLHNKALCAKPNRSFVNSQSDDSESSESITDSETCSFSHYDDTSDETSSKYSNENKSTGDADNIHHYDHDLPSKSINDVSGFYIPPPPLLFPFTPTGHCYPSQSLYSHSSLRSVKEAMFAQEAYKHALQHARKHIDEKF